MSGNQRTLNVIATAYTSKCKGCSGVTYSGYPVHDTVKYQGLRIIASDNNVIPLYSIVKVETKSDSFIAIVLDRGGAIKNLRIDYLVSTYDEALKFGRQRVKVTILRNGKGD